MNIKNKSFISFLIFALILSSVICISGCLGPDENNGDLNSVNESNGSVGKTITVVDDLGRTVEVPSNPQKIGLVGSGSARYMVYLQSVDRIVGVDTTDNSTQTGRESRPYMLSYPEIAKMPLLGSKKAQIDAELALKVSPDVILCSSEGASSIKMADDAMAKTGIPIVCFNQYCPADDFDKFSYNMRLLGTVIGKSERAEEVITFFGSMIDDLSNRVPSTPVDEKPVVYLGGVANRGSHGMISTKPNFIGFNLLKANHKVSEIGDLESSNIGKENILKWDPDILFVDLATRNAAGGGGLVELKTDPSYQTLKAVRNGEIYCIMPDTSCKANHGTSFANAYFVGTVLYPENFKDINASEKADEIYTFLVGKPVFDQLYANTGSLGYSKVDLNTI
ncbi:MAG: ABC transporter substrate-binding protein [Methanosarcinaceae archaeon]|nr:ABC transporter substrate-binding protein [Methanosarcinaceae archaeon]